MTDRDYMSMALELAERGRGWVEPNPLVGAVVVRAGEIVGQGWHEKFGQAHAEINALAEAEERARGATLYVTLEPCSHFGKTPPCTAAVIGAGISRVVFAMLDPFPQVSGQGASRLREAGIVVEVGVSEVAARQLNAPYLKRLRTGRPWVHAKWAMSLDGKIATRTNQSKWITGEAARARAHALRGRMDAILIGKGTLLADDPLLTARPPGPRSATRVVLSANGSTLPKNCRLLDTAQVWPVLVCTDSAHVDALASWRQRGADIVGFPGAAATLDIKSVLTELGQRGMTNVLVEGGGDTLGRFLTAGEIDEVHAFVAPKLLGGANSTTAIAGIGIDELHQAVHLNSWTIEALGADMYIHGSCAPVT